MTCRKGSRKTYSANRACVDNAFRETLAGVVVQGHTAKGPGGPYTVTFLLPSSPALS
jgi:hypothetical protein